MNKEKNNKVNIITGAISPADTRVLKEILEDFDIDYILLLDISENLDGGHGKEYNRLPMAGTSIDEIKLMAGAKATVELSTFVQDENSVGMYLENTFDVKNYRVNIPVGLRDTDKFLQVLSIISNKEIPIKYTKQRERYIDGMIDSHKYNAEGRIVIYGEPDFVYSSSRLAIENGVVPVVIATGDVCKELEELLRAEVDELSDNLFAEKCVILNDADFKKIERYSVDLKANIMLGNSYGRRIEEKHGIPLVRASFPIQDRMGGQRIVSIGYEGSMNLSDKITNVILSNKDSTFRKKIYNEFYKGEKQMEILKDENKSRTLSIEEKTKTHPCFSCDSAHKYARMHLPIAPKCNVSCNYCLKKFDCVNESRPGVTTQILSPEEAFEKYKYVKAKMPNLKVVGIAGPGDSLANFEETRETLKLIKEYDPEVTFCLSTNGLMLPFYAEELINLGVTHVTITINAIDPNITAKVYKYIDYLGVTYTGVEGTKILLNNQLSGLKYLTDRGIVVKVNIVMLKGINDNHIEEITKKVKEYGATITNIMQMIPVKGSVFENMPLVSIKEINDLRKICGENIKQMYHCKQCRADAIGTLDNDQSLKISEEIEEEKSQVKVLKFAVATKSGIGVDLHFGHALEFEIYEYKNKKVALLERRSVLKYCNGKEDCDEEDKFTKILNVIKDCDGVISLRIGDEPRKKLQTEGIVAFMSCERVENAVEAAAESLIRDIESEEIKIKRA
jgi:MoaA/NifB/PqqE/SkfB family radical SAM enzyme